MDTTFKQLYAWYIGSESWKALREVRLKRDKRTCQRCGATEQLHVHHLTYERFTHEDIADLITVCENCHDYIHRQARENPRLTLEEVTKRAVRQLRGRGAMRQLPRRKPVVTVAEDERCKCGHLIRIPHKHGPDGPMAVRSKRRKPKPGPRLGPTPPPGKPVLPLEPPPEFIWVCTKKAGWHKERNESSEGAA